MSKRTARIATITLAASATLAATAPVWSQAEVCRPYVQKAVAQAQDNLRMNCGGQGADWSTDAKAHMTWCTSVTPGVWQAKIAERQKMLDACAKKPPAKK